VFAVTGAYLISRVVFESLEARFLNQLVEVGTLSADRMVMEEQQRLNTLRLIANTEGIAAAVKAASAEQLRLLILPLAVNAREDVIEILDRHGLGLLSLRHTDGDSAETYAASQGDVLLREYDFVQRVLKHTIDSAGDKYAGFARLPWGDYFFVAGPLLDNDNQVIGAVLVGRSLKVMTGQFRQETLAHTTIYSAEGEIVASTLINPALDSTALDAERLNQVKTAGDSLSVLREVTAGSLTYTEILGPWQARDTARLGVIGTALPQSFLTSTTDSTRIQIMVVVAIGLLLVLAVGVVLAQRITQPLIQIVQASSKVARGSLDVTVKPVGNDELAVLAHAFNRMIAGMREVTERRLREIELMRTLEKERDLRELKSKFVSVVSHEFRTPLTTILSSSDLIKTYYDTLPQDKRSKHFDRIETSVTNMKRLLEDVLIIGKAESGRLSFEPIALDFDQFCRDLTDEIQYSAQGTHRLLYTRAAETRWLEADEKLLRVALSNLLSNAVKYSPAGGDVLFDVQQTGDFFVVCVKDSGIGIPAKDQQRLFDSFQRSGNVGNIPGTGLGLYITKMAVELHGGTITFESQENVGTTFIVRLPLKQPAETQL
jgi:signal transduction histidine kinase